MRIIPILQNSDEDDANDDFGGAYDDDEIMRSEENVEDDAMEEDEYEKDEDEVEVEDEENEDGMTPMRTMEKMISFI